MTLMPFLRVAVAVGAGVLLAGPARIAGAQADGPTYLDPPRALAEHAFTDQTGTSLSTADLRGRPAVLFFGFTHCPDVCPLTLARLSAVPSGR